MKRSNALVAAATLFLLGMLLPLAAHAASPEEDVTAAYTAWDAAFNAGDAAAVAALYTDDAIFLPPTHDVVEGPAGVEKFMSGLFNMGITGHTLEIIKVSGDGNLVVAAAKWTAIGKDASGADHPSSGVATHVFERQADGSLKLKLHTFN